jgi:rRNA small subunit pseudouridine methyltransferase Nep1
MTLTLIFLETSLERVPKSIARHPAVLNDARRRGKKPTELILDDSKHHTAMKKLPKWRKRGRPDIIHVCLLSVLDSRIPVNIYIHTINDEVIWINNQTRLPRNYNRFVGLMEDLFKKQVIAHGNTELLKILDVGLDELINSISSKIVLMSEEGEYNGEELRNIFRSEENVAVCIGAFPHGEFEEETIEIMEKHKAISVSFGKESLTSLYVTNRVLCIYEGI